LPPGGQAEAYSNVILTKIGVKKVEIINNEVIAAGQLKANLQQVVLVHCRVTPALLEFTVRSQSQVISNSMLQIIQISFAY
jgi:hypothetical protein